MDNYDLKIIKKKYGEKMSHLCRDLFPSILETKGLLSKLMLDNFESTRFLYDDIVEVDLIDEFKNFICSKAVKINRIKKGIKVENPVQLMKKAGYILKECHTEEEIQEYKRYYKPGEELCTFKGGRLDKCRVFFAVKENVCDIKRDDFLNPRRQDEYGTSVISIQFSRDKGNYLSIKNRYNHSVVNPDATFSNDLDNIIAGLTDSFEEYYDLKQTVRQGEFELSEYVMDETGKYHRYNYEIDNIYYCPNNTIIENGVVKKLEPEKYILMDYFILDLVNKEIKTYGNNTDTFVNDINDINKIDIKNIGDEKEITIFCDAGSPIIIRSDKYNRIVEYSNDRVTEVHYKFLYYNQSLRKIDIPNVKTIGYNSFCGCNLTSFTIPEGVTRIGNHAFESNKLSDIIIPDSVEYIGKEAFSNNKLTHISIPDTVIYIGEEAFMSNKLTTLEIPRNINRIKRGAFNHNNLTEIVIPANIKDIESFAFTRNKIENIVIEEGLESIGYCAFSLNNFKNVEIPKSVTKISPDAFDNFVDVTKRSLPEKEQSLIKSR